MDPLGKTLSCTTKNLEFTKVMKVEESVHIRANEEGCAPLPLPRLLNAHIYSEKRFRPMKRASGRALVGV